MKPATAIIKLRLRLNKSHSSDYDNIPNWIAVEAINKYALEWSRAQIEGFNKRQEGAEETLTKVDDLQFLLEPYKLKGRNNNLFFESKTLPENYLAYSRIIPIGSKDTCKKQSLKSHLVEEANIPQLLKDWSWQPSFKWRETIHTLVGNSIRVYTKQDFTVDELDMLYYRRPIEMDIAGYRHEDGRDSANVDLEFKKDIAEIILDGAAAIIAGDIESLNALEILKGRADNGS